ncbi:MAG: helix-turn-helix domain-containing protein [Terriglobales bacterium]
MTEKEQFNHTGSSFDNFLEEEGLLDETEALAVKRVIAWQLRRAMKRRNITKYAMAKHLRTSRSQVDRLLDPQHTGVTIGTITRAAKAVGHTLRLNMVNSPGIQPKAAKAGVSKAGKPRRASAKAS